MMTMTTACLTSGYVRTWGPPRRGWPGWGRPGAALDDGGDVSIHGRVMVTESSSAQAGTSEWHTSPPHRGRLRPVRRKYGFGGHLVLSSTSWAPASPGRWVASDRSAPKKAPGSLQKQPPLAPKICFLVHPINPPQDFLCNIFSGAPFPQVERGEGTRRGGARTEHCSVLLCGLKGGLCDRCNHTAGLGLSRTGGVAQGKGRRGREWVESETARKQGLLCWASTLTYD